MKHAAEMAKFHDNRFRHSSNITIIAEQSERLSCLYYWTAGSYELHPYDGLRWHDVSTEFHNDRQYRPNINPTLHDVQFENQRFSHKLYSECFSTWYLMEYKEN
jgi:hypothetical protein